MAAKSLICCLALSLLAGCAAPLAGAGAGAAVAVAPSVIGALTTGVTVLSDAAKLACAVQAFANATGNTKLSTEAGFLCKW